MSKYYQLENSQFLSPNSNFAKKTCYFSGQDSRSSPKKKPATQHWSFYTTRANSLNT